MSSTAYLFSNCSDWYKNQKNEIRNLLSDPLNSLRLLFMIFFFRASENTENIYSYLEAKCVEMKHEKNLESIHNLTKNLHVFPDFHGNRSPLADPEMKGSIVGLDLDKSEKNLALIYLSTIQALAYETKLIVDHLTRYVLRFLESIDLMQSQA